MQQRYYDPSIGRFLSVDPVTADGNTGGNFNRYWYANNNPYRFTDPDGRLTWDEFTTGVKNFIAPTGQQFAQRGEAGTPASNAMGAVKQVANTVINVVGAVIQTPADRLTGGGLPNIPIANNELAGAAATELGLNVGAIAAPLTRSGASGLGDLTVREAKQIQTVVNKAGRPLEVVGSTARGARGAGSDIDYVVPPSSASYFEGLQSQLPSIDPAHGIIPGVGNPNIGPVIRFEPTK